MTNTVLIKRSSTANAVPLAGNLQPGELAINYNDGNLFYKNTSNVVTVIASNQFVSVSGNVTGGNITTTGNILANGLISASGTITIAGITSTGVIDLTNAGNVSLGSNSNVHITGGSSGDILTTDGTGNLSWSAPTVGGSVITVDDFTGNGVQTQFTLSVTPPGIDSTTVNYNGIIQLRTGYTLSGANVVFATPPANGSSIEVTTISVNLAGAAGSNTQVQFNNSGSFGASSAFTFNTTTNTLSATNFVGNGSQLTGVVATGIGVLDSLSVTGNTQTGNLLTGGLVSSAGNVTGGNLVTGGLISATSTITSAANIAGANLVTGGLISATSTITGGNLATGGTASVTGNITSGNVLTGGLISATGNVSGNYFIGNGSQLTGVTASSVDANNLTGNTLSSTVLFSSLTSVGTLGNLGVSGNITGGNVLTNGLISATSTITSAANITGANLLTGGLISATSTITGGNLATGGLISSAGNVTGGNVLTGGLFSSTGNITSGNILTDGLISSAGNITSGNVRTSGLISASGNVYASQFVGTLAGNVEAVTVSASGNVTGGNILTGGLISSAGNITGSTGQFNNGLTVVGNITATGNINYQNVTDLVVGDPLIFIGANNTSDIVDLGIVASANVGGLFQHLGFARDHTDDVWKLFGNVVTEPTTVIDWGNAVYQPFLAGNVSSTGTVISVGNITGGNLLTGGLVSATGTVTGSSLLGSVVSASGNILTSGAISSAGNITTNASSFFIGNGSQLTGVIASSGGFPITAGTSNIAGATNGNIGISVAGASNIALVTINGVDVVGALSANGNVTGGNILTGGLISATGNITGNYILGNGSQLTGIDATSIQNGTSNVRVVSSGGNVAIGIGGTSNVAVFATTGEYITGVLSVSGNTTGGNLLTGGLISATGTVTGSTLIGSVITASGNVTGGNVLTGGLISATSGITGGNLLTGGVVSATANISGGNLLTAGLVSATGNVSGNYILGNGSQLTGIDATSIQNGTSNVRVVSSGGNVAIGIGGTSNVFVVATTGIYTTGLSSVSGNITSGNLLTQGIVSSAGIVSSGTVDLIGSGNISLGNVGNVHITGGTSGYVLSTNGSGALDWTQIPSSSITVDNFTGNGVQSQFTLSVTPGGIQETTVNYNGIIQLRTSYSLSGANVVFSSPPASGALLEVTTVSNSVITTSAAGSNTQVQFNDSGSIGASSAFTFDKTANAVSVGGLTGSRSNITVTTSTAIDTFATGAYRGAKYLIQGGDGVDYQASDVLLVHNTTNAYIYVNTVCSNNVSNVLSISAEVNAGNVILRATKISSNVTTVNMTVLYVKD